MASRFGGIRLKTMNAHIMIFGIWIIIWAIICCLSKMFAILTYALDSGKVLVSETVIVNTASAYLMYSCA